MRGNIAQLMQQAQKMQENVQRAQEEVAKIEVTGSAGGGMVSVTISGRMECRKVRIDPSVLSDPEMAVVRRYVGTLTALEVAVPAASDNLDTDQASMWSRNKDELPDRIRLLDDWRRSL